MHVCMYVCKQACVFFVRVMGSEEGGGSPYITKLRYAFVWLYDRTGDSFYAPKPPPYAFVFNDFTSFHFKIDLKESAACL